MEGSRINRINRKKRINRKIGKKQEEIGVDRKTG